MSVTGIDNVVGRLKLAFEQAQGEKTEAAITEMLIIGAANAWELTPIDQSNLVNSQGKKTYPGKNGWEGSVFYGARYAGWVHKMTGKLKGKPRADFGRTREGKAFGGGSHTGNYWGPDAEPQFLTKGMEQMGADSAKDILKKHYSV